MHKKPHDAPNHPSTQKGQLRADIENLKNGQYVTAGLEYWKNSHRDPGNVPLPPNLRSESHKLEYSSVGGIMPPAAPIIEERSHLSPERANSKELASEPVVQLDSETDIKDRYIDNIGKHIIAGTLKRYLKELEDKEVPIEKVIGDVVDYTANSLGEIFEDISTRGLVGYFFNNQNSNNTSRVDPQVFGFDSIYNPEEQIAEMSRSLAFDFHSSMRRAKLQQKDAQQKNTSSPTALADIFNTDAFRDSIKQDLDFSKIYNDSEQELPSTKNPIQGQKVERYPLHENIYQQDETHLIANPMNTKESLRVKESLGVSVFNCIKEIGVLSKELLKPRHFEESRVIRGKISNVLNELAEYSRSIRTLPQHEQEKVAKIIREIYKNYGRDVVKTPEKSEEEVKLDSAKNIMSTFFKGNALSMKQARKKPGYPNE